jgi:hypothetical protein
VFQLANSPSPFIPERVLCVLEDVYSSQLKTNHCFPPVISTNEAQHYLTRHMTDRGKAGLARERPTLQRVVVTRLQWQVDQNFGRAAWANYDPSSGLSCLGCRFSRSCLYWRGNKNNPRPYMAQKIYRNEPKCASCSVVITLIDRPCHLR